MNEIAPAMDDNYAVFLDAANQADANSPFQFDLASVPECQGNFLSYKWSPYPLYRPSDNRCASAGKCDGTSTCGGDFEYNF